VEIKLDEQKRQEWLKWLDILYSVIQRIADHFGGDLSNVIMVTSS